MSLLNAEINTKKADTFINFEFISIYLQNLNIITSNSKIINRIFMPLYYSVSWWAN
jgi:hypothetical protein